MKTKSLFTILIGLVILIIGLGLFLQGLNLIDFGGFFGQWWPSLVIIVGLLMLATNPRAAVWAIIVTLFGALLLLDNLGFINVSVWNLIWPTILIIVGFSIVFNRGKDKTQDVKDDDVEAVALFSGHDIRSASHNFKGGNLTAIFGGVDLDLRNAKINGVVKLSITCLFGGVDIKVPKGWEVKTDGGVPIFGAWENKSARPETKDAPKLIVNGTCIFGGVTIKH